MSTRLVPVAPAVVPVAVTDSVWRAPLIPAALAMTAGIVLDRYACISFVFSLIAAAASLVAWMLSRTNRVSGLPLVYLTAAVVAVGAAYHQVHREIYPADDIGNIATADPRPARLRGVLADEPVVSRQVPNRLQSFHRPDPTSAVLQVTHRKQGDDWRAISGHTRLVVGGQLDGFHVGDQVEAVGTLTIPAGPANPGEFDVAALLRDQRIRSQLLVRKSSDAVVRRAEGTSLLSWLMRARGWGQETLERSLPPEQSGVATALLLGAGSTMTSADWQKYIRTGVIHVLAISGQHLVILAMFLWGLLRLLGVRRVRGAWLVALLLFAYALLAGGRPPVLRAAIMVCAGCGGIILRRPALSANSFALAWIIVVFLNPADLFNTGCQLSFLSVAVLFWGTSRLRRDPDPLDALVENSRPAWQRAALWLGRVVVESYAVTAVIWLTLAPLVASRYHLVSPVAILIGPPLVLLTTVALLAGFLLLLMAALCWPLSPLFAGITRVSLAACEILVNFSDQLPLYRYVGDMPAWWLWGFYLALSAALLLDGLRRRQRPMLLAGLAWLGVGLMAVLMRPTPPTLRCTFLAVGHGGCTVIETPEGRTLLYDAGAMSGPDVTRRLIAPFLWHRGIRRVDEIFLSHADLDHFNGLPALLERFSIGQATCTPTFADRSTQGVGLTLEALQRHGVPLRTVHAGDRLRSGTVEMDVLHPPTVGPEGKENVRSLVLLVRHAGHALLLTGDLEQAGLRRVLEQPPVHVDVMMAPHHGSRDANQPELAAWARPKVVVSCQGPPRGRSTEPYTAAGALFLGTWPHGAVTLHSQPGSLLVETFVSELRWELQRDQE